MRHLLALWLCVNEDHDCTTDSDLKRSGNVEYAEYEGSFGTEVRCGWDPSRQSSFISKLCCVLAPRDGIKAVKVCGVFCSINLFCNGFLFLLTGAAPEQNENSFSWLPLQAVHYPSCWKQLVCCNGHSSLQERCAFSTSSWCHAFSIAILQKYEWCIFSTKPSELELASGSCSESSQWWTQVHKRTKTWAKAGIFCVVFFNLFFYLQQSWVTSSHRAAKFRLFQLFLQCLYTLFFMRICKLVCDFRAVLLLVSPCTARFWSSTNFTTVTSLKGYFSAFQLNLCPLNL